MILRRIAETLVNAVEWIVGNKTVRYLFSFLRPLTKPLKWIADATGLSRVANYVWREFVDLFEWGHTVEAEDPVTGAVIPEYHIRPAVVGFGKLMGGMLVRDRRIRSGCIPAVLLLVVMSVFSGCVGYGTYWYLGWEEVPAVTYEDEKFKIEYHWRYRDGDLRPVHRTVIPTPSELSEFIGSPEEIERIKEHFQNRKGSYFIPREGGDLQLDKTILLEDLPSFFNDHTKLL